MGLMPDPDRSGPSRGCGGVMRSGKFSFRNLRLISHAGPPDDPPLCVGDYCLLSSGSPPLLVVDADDYWVVVAWGGISEGCSEATMPRAMVRRTEPRP